LSELFEEVASREPLVTGVAGVVATQSRAAQIGELLRRHLCHPGAVEVIPERLVVFRAVGCQQQERSAQRDGNESKCETLHIDLPMTANDLPIRSSDASFVARCVQIRVSAKKVSKSRQKMRILNTLVRLSVHLRPVSRALCQQPKSHVNGAAGAHAAAAG
jgi:hypothetical protein